MDQVSPVKGRWWLWLLAVLFAIVILFILLLPTLLSTESGKRFLISKVEENTKGKLTIKTLSLGWFSDQVVQDFSYTDGSGSNVEIKKVTSTASFWNLLFRRGSLGKTSIETLTANLKPFEAAKPGPSSGNRSAPKKKKKGAWKGFRGHFILTNGSVFLPSGDSLQKMNLEMDLPKMDTLSFLSFNGETSGGTFSATGALKETFVGKGSFERFPTAPIDSLIALIKPEYEGLIVAAIGNTFNGEFSSSEQGKILATFRSPLLNVDLSSTYQDKAFKVTKGRIDWTIQPLLFNHFATDIELQEAMQGALNIQSATLPNDHRMAATGSLSLKGGTFLIKGEEIALQTMQTSFQTSDLKKELALSLNGTIDRGELSGELTIKDPLEKRRSFPSADLNIERLSLSLVDSLSKKSFSKYLGSSFSGKIRKTGQTIDLSGKTPLLAFSPIKLNLDEQAVLSAPCTFEYLMTSDLYENLAAPFTLRGTLNELSAPLDFSDASFILACDVSSITLKNLLSLGEATLSDLQMNINATSLETIAFHGSSPLLFDTSGLGASLFGQSLTLNAEGTFQIDEDLAISPLNLTLEGTKFQGKIYAAIEENLFILKKALQASFLLEPEQINPILAKDAAYPLLTRPTPMLLEIAPSQIPLKGADLSSLAIQGKGEIPTLSMADPKSRYPFEFRNIALDFDLGGKKKKQTVHLEGKAIDDKAPAGKIELSLEGAELISRPKSVKASLTDFSSQIADVFFKMRGQLPDLIGETLTLNYQMEQQEKDQSLELHLKSPLLTIDGSFTAGKFLELKTPRKPLKIHWEMTEKSYDAFRRWRSEGKPLRSNDSLFTIAKPGKLKIHVSPFSIPLKEGGKGFPRPDLNLYASQFDADVMIDALTLADTKTQALAELSDFDFSIFKKNAGPSPLIFRFNGNVSPQGRGGRGKVQGKGKLEDFLSPTGSFDPSNVTTDIHLAIKNLPTIFIDALSKLDTDGSFPPSAFLGDLFNATLDAEIKESQGSINGTLDASACQALFNGFLSSGVLYLKEPLKATFTVTPELNRVLEKSADLIVVAIEKPLTLYVHDEGFSVPLKNLHIRNMSFSYGQLDLGQIIVRDTGSAGDVSSLFKMDDRGNKSIWFAPSIFNMREGKMYVDRTEILYNKAYQVCLWGDIFFPQRRVDMTLGLTAQALRAALGIKDLDENYVLKVPVEGPFGNVKVDKGAGLSKIAILLGRKTFSQQKGWLGKALGTLGDLTDSQSDVPPPKPPFPWQN